jgi:hypothetical protein
MNRETATIAITVLAAAIILIGCGERTPEPTAAEAFFENLREMCGETFDGYTEFTLLENHPLADGRLTMHIESCSETEIRIPFIVNDDSSRTWVLTLTEEGLLFQHDHRHADGTPEDTTMYGGWASDDGTPYIQYFPADEYTAKLIPEAATNVWMMSIDPDSEEFVYYLERHDEPRFRAIFDISQPRTIGE